MVILPAFFGAKGLCDLMQFLHEKAGCWMSAWRSWAGKGNKNRRIEMDGWDREKNTEVASRIAQIVEAEAIDGQYGEERKALIELVAKLVFPYKSVKLVLE